MRKIYTSENKRKKYLVAGELNFVMKTSEVNDTEIVSEALYLLFFFIFLLSMLCLCHWSWLSTASCLYL